MLTLLFDGIAYGMVLFILSCGLSVTLGVMKFVNLAHGVFAMVGGYGAVLLVNRLGLPFAAGVAAAGLVTAGLGFIFERLLFSRLYDRGALDQVLLTIGIVFMAVAAVDYAMGSQQVFVRIPPALEGQTSLLGASVGRYRLMIVVLCGALALSLQLVLSRTQFGRRLRAAVDNPRVAAALGINVAAMFSLTFAAGCGLAGLGGALGAEILGLDPLFPLKFLIYFLVVVAVGGTRGVAGPFVAALVLGLADVAGKYYLPQMGAFIMDGLMIALLMARPHGLVARRSERWAA